MRRDYKMNEPTIVKKSTTKGKKFMAILPNGKKVHFGAQGMSDYTVHGDTERRKSYLARHGAGGQDWGDRETAGFWSRWLLWEKRSLGSAASALRGKGLNRMLKV